MNDYKSAAIAAANWWAEKMQKPLNQDNGTKNEPNGEMMFLLMNMVSTNGQKSITPEKIETFKTALVEHLISLPEEGIGSRAKWVFGVDYNPCETLAFAMDKAGINYSALPCKSTTNINRRTFEVNCSFGYGGEWVPIYGNENNSVVSASSAE